MRISDWSSDVCSSDLALVDALERLGEHVAVDVADEGAEILVVHFEQILEHEHRFLDRLGGLAVDLGELGHDAFAGRLARARHDLGRLARAAEDDARRLLASAGPDRKSVVEGKGVSLRVDFGGWGYINKKKII